MIIALCDTFDVFHTRREYLRYSEMELRANFARVSGI